jgi:nucleoside-diphosphate-sugar epimerase
MMKHLYKNKKVLITGGAGFIGSHLAHRLVALGANVTILDDLSTGSLNNLAEISNDIRFIHGSITNPTVCIEASRDTSFIFHLAAFLSVPKSLETPRECHRINIDGTFNMLEAARINDVKRFIFSSSAAVYGQEKGECTEDMVCYPLSPYGYSKLIGEKLCQQYATCFGINTICLRYFNVYGPRQNPTGTYAAVVAKFKHQMEHNLPITIFGDGSQTRDFVPVSSVVDANIVVALLPQINMNGAVFNVGSGKSITLLQLIEQLKKEHPTYCIPTIFESARSGDLQSSTANINKLTNILHTL